MKVLAPISWVLSLGLGAAAQEFSGAAPDSLLAARGEQFVQSKRLGAILLWGGLLIASLIIGFVRARNRRRT